MRFAGSLCLAVCLGLGLCQPLSALADSGVLPNTSVTLSVVPGLGGAVKPGNWAPVQIELSNEGRDINGEVQVSVEDNTSRATTFTPTPTVYAAAAILPTHSRKRLEVDVMLPTQGNRVQVKLVEGSSVLRQQEAQFEPVSANNVLCAAITRDSQSYDILGTIDLPGRQQHAKVVSLDPADLPGRPQLLSSLDCLIVGNVNLSSLSVDQKGSIDAWVGRGGLLIGIGGANWTRSLAFLPQGLLPVEVNGSTELPSIDDLATFTKAPSPGKGPWLVSTTKSASGDVLVRNGNVPLLSVRRHGLGTVFYLAMDPTQSPLREWQGSADLWRYVLAYVNTPLLSASPFASTSVGWGRLPRTALAAAPNLNPPAPKWFMALLALYVVLLGPVNYVLLRRADRRDWAWLSLPVLAALTTFASFRLAADRKGSDVGLNEVSLVRSDPGVGTAYVRTYVGVYSPKDAALDIVTSDGALISAPTSTLGLGFRVGGAQGTFSDGSTPARIEPVTVMESGPTSMPGFNATANSFAAFTVDSTARFSSGVTDTLTTDGRFVRGTVTNSTGQKINDAMILLGDTPVVKLGAFSPGMSKDINVPLATATPRRGQLSSLLFPVAAGRPASAPLADVARRDVVDSAFNPFFQSTGLGNGGLVLLGWLDHSPLDVTLRQGRPAVNIQTLYTAGLTLGPVSGQELEIPPVAFQTRVLASLAANRQQGGTYDLSSGGALGLEFDLPFSAGFKPSQLVLHVAGSLGTSDTLAPGAELGTAAWYRWSDGQWIDVPIAIGDNVIPNPGQFVSGAGQVRVRYSYKPQAAAPTGSTNLTLSRFDLSMNGTAP